MCWIETWGYNNPITLEEINEMNHHNSSEDFSADEDERCICWKTKEEVTEPVAEEKDPVIISSIEFNMRDEPIRQWIKKNNLDKDPTRAFYLYRHEDEAGEICFHDTEGKSRCVIADLGQSFVLYEDGNVGVE